MSDRLALTVLKRLRAVEWIGDWDEAFGHVMSRRLWMREYLRRAAWWAQADGAEEAWPFFDVAAYAAPDFLLGEEVDASLAAFLRTVPAVELRITAAGAVRLAARRRSGRTSGPACPICTNPC